MSRAVLRRFAFGPSAGLLFPFWEFLSLHLEHCTRRKQTLRSHASSGQAVRQRTGNEAGRNEAVGNESGGNGVQRGATGRRRNNKQEQTKRTTREETKRRHRSTSLSNIMRTPIINKLFGDMIVLQL